MSDLLKICNLNEIPENALLKKEIEGHSIILIRKNKVVHVIEDQCSHMNYPLSDGELDNDEIECSYHGAKFNIKSGYSQRMLFCHKCKRFIVPGFNSRIPFQ